MLRSVNKSYKRKILHEPVHMEFLSIEIDFGNGL
ncbi:unnamed protein product [Brassica oleracea]